MKRVIKASSSTDYLTYEEMQDVADLARDMYDDSGNELYLDVMEEINERLDQNVDEYDPSSFSTEVIDFIKFVTKYSVMQKNEKGTWELRHTSWNEDKAWREADKLTGQVKVVYPDGLSIPKEDNRL